MGGWWSSVRDFDLVTRSTLITLMDSFSSPAKHVCVLILERTEGICWHDYGFGPVLLKYHD